TALIPSEIKSSHFVNTSPFHTPLIPSPPLFFFFNHTPTTQIYTLSLHDALPISQRRRWLTTYRGDSGTIVASVAAERRPRQPPRWCRPAAWSAITEAATSGLQLGVHSATHRSLPELEDGDLHREVVDSRDIITR